MLKLVKLQIALKPQLNLKISFNLEKYFQRFFDKISETISSYKVLKQDEKRRIKIEKIETSKYYKKVIEPTEDEIKLHKEYLKNSLKRNYFN